MSWESPSQVKVGLMGLKPWFILGWGGVFVWVFGESQIPQNGNSSTFPSRSGSPTGVGRLAAYPLVSALPAKEESREGFGVAP
jgi:hypothetical protein